MLEFKSWEWRERARERIAAKVAEFLASPEGKSFLHRKAMDDDPSREMPPDAITPARLRAAILDGLKYAPDGPDKLSDLDLELARVKLTVKWDERMFQMNIGWLGDANG